MNTNWKEIFRQGNKEVMNKHKKDIMNPKKVQTRATIIFKETGKKKKKTLNPPTRYEMCKKNK